MKAVLPQAETGVAIEFLKQLHPVRWDLAAIPPDTGRPEFRTFYPSEADEAEAWIEGWQGVAGLYYHVNQVRPGFRDRKATKGDIAKVLNIHADIDFHDEATLSKIRDFLPRPSVVVFSGGGYQPIWALQEPTTEFERVERINKAVAEELGGDNCHNIDRLLRLPGTINMPNAKKRAAGRVPTLARIV